MKKDLRKATRLAAIEVAKWYKGAGMRVPKEIWRIIDDYGIGKCKHLPVIRKVA